MTNDELLALIENTNPKKMPRSQKAFIAAACLLAAGAVAYVSGKISYSFGRLSGINCTVDAGNSLSRGDRDAFARKMTGCVRGTGMPIYENYVHPVPVRPWERDRSQKMDI